MADPLMEEATLLFTDIEGSTRLWERFPVAMSVALARHDSILRNAIEGNHGVVFKTMGDAFYAVFSRPMDAVAAAIVAQRDLHAERWGEVGQIRVRAALNTGEVERRAGDYFGPALNRVARLLSAGHGGQILLTLSTSETVRNDLSDDVKLRDMGERRLKDLPRPERVFQLVADGLPAAFPPLRTLDDRASNLPAQLTSLVGRKPETESVRRLLERPDVRLVTLTGPGGIGKTRLALHVAADVLDDFADGVFLVALAPVSEPALVATTIAQTLNVRDSGARPLLESLKDHLRPKKVLLLLDNFEQVMAAADIVGELLEVAPRLKVMVTTRRRLRLYGEQTFPVPPLGLPARRRVLSADGLAHHEATRLFVERAGAAKPDFKPTDKNAPAIAEICHRLDGLPLAIELAAARIRVLPPQAMLARLESSLKMATGGARNLHGRQQTLRATIEWSYNLLRADEQRILQCLAVFVAGCTVEAAEATCDHVDERHSGTAVKVCEGIESLVDKSMVRQERGCDGEPRFVMLQSIREYGLECLLTSGAMGEQCRRHATFFKKLVEKAEPELVGANQSLWLERLEADHDNLRAALTWMRDNGQAEQGLVCGIALWQFWWLRGYFTDGSSQLEALLEMARTSMPHPARAKVLTKMAELARVQGDYAKARSCITESLAIARPLGDRQGTAICLRELGRLSLEEGDLFAAQEPLEESLRLYRELGDRAGAQLSLTFLGGLLNQKGENEAARVALEESLSLAGDLGDKANMGVALMMLGRVALAQGQPTLAYGMWRDSITLFTEVGPRSAIAHSLEGLAELAIARDQQERALRIAATAAALRQQISAPQPPVLQAAFELKLAHARQALALRGDDVWSEGWALNLEQAIDYALWRSPQPDA